MTRQLAREQGGVPARSVTTSSSAVAQHKCACSGSVGRSGGGCKECGKSESRPTASMAIRRGHSFGDLRVHAGEGASSSGVHRSTVERGERGRGKTNRRFETFAITERDLSDPDVIARLNELSKVGLIEYLKQVKDLAVSEYILDLINKMAALPPCTTDELKSTTDQAEAARQAALPLVASAVKALGTVMTEPTLCAFAGNFNTTAADPELPTRRLVVARRLAALAKHMRTAVAYTCQPADDPVCMRAKHADTVAYVRGHKPPIKFCPPFREFASEPTKQQAIVIHEYAHFVGSVDDAGGYAFRGLGAEIGTCTVGTKFKGTGDVLINNADSLTGFVMQVGMGTSPSTPSGTPTAPGAGPGTSSATAAPAPGGE